MLADVVDIAVIQFTTKTKMLVAACRHATSTFITRYKKSILVYNPEGIV